MKRINRIERISNTASLHFKTAEGVRTGNNVDEVSRRFFNAAKFISDNGFIGFQIDAGTEADTVTVFTSDGVKVTKEDYEWIFRECCDVEDCFPSTGWDHFMMGRRIYVLSHRLSGERLAGVCRDYIDLDDSTYSRHSSRIAYQNEMFDRLKEAGASVSVLAGSNDDRFWGGGKVYFSLPDEMPLRLRGTISLAFPFMEAVEVSSTRHDVQSIDEANEAEMARSFGEEDEMAERIGSDDSISIHVMSVLIRLLMEGEKKNRLADNGGGIDPDIAIEDLDLSVRTYNCLKRAGKHSVGELLAMSEEEFLRVRNLGRKCANEVVEKLNSLGKWNFNSDSSDSDNESSDNESSDNESSESSGSVQNTAKSRAAMLDELIGLHEVKEQIRKITAFARMKKDMAAHNHSELSVVMNMEFVGNPGTAKTTVARIAAGLLKDVGLLESDDIIEVGRSDIVGRYVGHTASNVKEIFSRAKGKLLFIDEAYSLDDAYRGSFGDEAINAIVQEMENRRNDTVVIFAGYPDEMDEFFSQNPGLRSRVPFRVCFNDYSPEEMERIVESEAKKRGFSVSPEACARVTALCAEATGRPELGNGRYCRNLVENAIMCYASRIYGDGNEDSVREPVNDFALLSEDFHFPADTGKNQFGMRPQPIGFTADCSIR